MSEFESWHEEMQSAYLYRVMCDVETEPRRQQLFQELEKAAREQALIWEEKMAAAGVEENPRFKASPRARLVAWLLRRFGPRAMRPILAAMKVRGLSVYSTGGIEIGHPKPTSVEEIGHRHVGIGSGGNFRAAVFGVNDGLVSNAALIMGMAGATQDGSVVLLAGVAGLLAGAFSMAAGEYVSMRSQRELFEYQIGLEREELLEYPDEEAEELALIYNARGIPMEQARKLAHDLMQEPEHALDTLAREELGLNPDDLGSPWGASLFSFASFAVGAAVPLLPFVYGSGASAVRTAAGTTAIALFGIGAVLSLFTGRSTIHGGLRMLLIGGGAGIVTYVMGYLLGISLA